MILRVSLLITLGFLISACGKTNSSVDEFVPEEQSLCGGESIPNQYIVEFKNGDLVRYNFNSIDELKKNLIEPNLNELKRIEWDQKFDINSFSLQPKSTSTINNWAYENINIEKIWSEKKRGSDIIVAVIDSGVDITHNSLKNQIFRNQNEIPNNDIDDDQNGYIDDVNGYDFLNSDIDPDDEIFHGTHIAGVIAAEHSSYAVDDGILLSVAPQAKIMPLKFLGSSGGSLSDAIEAINYAVDNGAQIINASWGGPGCSVILKDRIQKLSEEGVLFVAASGNNGNNLDLAPEYPAAFSGAAQITVGSITAFGGMSSFSNYSDQLVQLFAPGSAIASTVPGQQIMEMSGTSMATPFVSGAAAVLWSINPQWSVTDIKNAILKSVRVKSHYRNSTRGTLDFSDSLQFL